jgi:hypothetical protein
MVTPASRRTEAWERLVPMFGSSRPALSSNTAGMPSRPTAPNSWIRPGFHPGPRSGRIPRPALPQPAALRRLAADCPGRGHPPARPGGRPYRPLDHPPGVRPPDGSGPRGARWPPSMATQLVDSRPPTIRPFLSTVLLPGRFRSTSDDRVNFEDHEVGGCPVDMPRPPLSPAQGTP